MILTTHAVVGAALASFVPSHPITAFALGRLTSRGLQRSAPSLRWVHWGPSRRDHLAANEKGCYRTGEQAEVQPVDRCGIARLPCASPCIPEIGRLREAARNGLPRWRYGTAPHCPLRLRRDLLSGYDGKHRHPNARRNDPHQCRRSTSTACPFTTV
jgi:hypothetical protein